MSKYERIFKMALGGIGFSVLLYAQFGLKIDVPFYIWGIIGALLNLDYLKISDVYKQYKKEK